MAALQGPSARGADPAISFSKDVAGLLKEHCVECHGGEKPKAKLDLSGSRTVEELEKQGALWFRVMERVEAGEMPPKEEGPLPQEARAGIVRWVRGDLSAHLMERQAKEGRSSLRRLSRNEYANTVQDLFGIRPPVSRMLPPDGRVDGYDKVRAALPFSASATDAHLKLAEGIVSQMSEVRTTKETHWLYAKESEQSKGHVLELPEGWWVSFNSDTTSGPMGNVWKEGGKVSGSPSGKKVGRHLMRIHAYGYQTDKPMPVGIYTGHTSAYPQMLNLVKVIEIPPGEASVVETEIYLRSMKDSDIGVTDGIRLIPFGLGVPVPKNTQAAVQGKGKPGLALNSIELEELDELLPGQHLLFDGLPEALVPNNVRRSVSRPGSVSREALERGIREAIGRVGSRLFRRDLSKQEISRRLVRVMDAIDSSGKPLDAYMDEVVSMMTSPDFLTLIERPGRLGEFELATRLSYFLWSSAPDEQLLALARDGKLSDARVLREQTERMLDDARSERFVVDFTDQWLGLWGIDNTTPDKDLYPEFDEHLKVSSLMETRQDFRRMLAENRSVKEFVAPRTASLNERLAKHYGVGIPAGSGFREVDLPEGTPFGGIWTHASVMKVTANGTLTSPIKRGVWISERLLGLKIPPPPPVEGIEPDIRGAKTFREQLDLHRKGTCSSCHAKFDPYGFALESFDVMGQFRGAYRVQDEGAAKGARRWKEGLPVDASGITPRGERFEDVRGLREILGRDVDALAKGLARHLITYSTGEPAGPLDEPVVTGIVAEAAKANNGVRAILHAVVQSELFRSK